MPEAIDNADTVDSILDKKTGTELNARKEEVLDQTDVSSTDSDIGKLDGKVEEIDSTNT